MLIQLIRNEPQGSAITGRLLIDGRYSCDTLEHLTYAIPTGFYRLRLTHSPRFQEVLPILDAVYGFARDPQSGQERTGIRIHAGNTIADTTGCILVGQLTRISPTGEMQKHPRLLSSRQRLNALREYLLNYQKLNPYEEIYIQLESPDPYPDADIPCDYEQQQHIQESLQRAHRLRQERR